MHGGSGSSHSEGSFQVGHEELVVAIMMMSSHGAGKCESDGEGLLAMGSG